MSPSAQKKTMSRMHLKSFLGKHKYFLFSGIHTKFLKQKSTRRSMTGLRLLVGLNENCFEFLVFNTLYTENFVFGSVFELRLYGFCVSQFRFKLP